jgi:hypothetical protein
MKILSMKHLVAAAMVFVAPAAMSQAYPKVSMSNYATTRVNVVVKYAGCKSDSFLVGAGRRMTHMNSNDEFIVIPAVNEPSANRGVCLVTSITGTFEGGNPSGVTIMPYHSSGTSYSQFRIRERWGTAEKIWEIHSQASHSEDSTKYWTPRNKSLGRTKP